MNFIDLGRNGVIHILSFFDFIFEIPQGLEEEKDFNTTKTLFGYFKNDARKQPFFIFKNLSLMDLSSLQYLLDFRKEIISLKVYSFFSPLSVLEQDKDLKNICVLENLVNFGGVYLKLREENTFLPRFCHTIERLDIGFEYLTDNIVQGGFKKMKRLKKLEIRIEQGNKLKKEQNIISNIPSLETFTLSLGGGMEYSTYDKFLVPGQLNHTLKRLTLKWVTDLSEKQFKSLSGDFPSLYNIYFDKSLVSEHVIHLFDSPSLEILAFERTTVKKGTLSKIRNANKKLRILYFFSVSDQEHRFIRFSNDDISSIFKKCENLEKIFFLRCGLKDNHISQIMDTIRSCTSSKINLKKLDIRENPLVTYKSVRKLSNLLFPSSCIVDSSYIIEEFEKDPTWRKKMTPRFVSQILDFFLLEYSENNIKSILDYFGYFERDITRKIFILFPHVAEFQGYDIKHVTLPAKHIKSLFFTSQFSSSQVRVPFMFLSKCHSLETLVSVTFDELGDNVTCFDHFFEKDSEGKLPIFSTLRTLDIKTDQLDDRKIRVFNNFKNLLLLEIEMYGRFNEEHKMKDNKVKMVLPSIETLSLRFSSVDFFPKEFTDVIGSSKTLKSVQIRGGRICRIMKKEVLRFSDTTSLKEIYLESCILDLESFFEVLFPKLENVYIESAVLHLLDDEGNVNLDCENAMKKILLGDPIYFESSKVKKLAVENSDDTLPDAFVEFVCKLKFLVEFGVERLTEKQYIQLDEKKLVKKRVCYNIL